MSIELQDGIGNGGNGGGGGSSVGASLFDIKVKSQLVAEKGWAFQCKSTRQDLAKADVPTLYADIKDKYDNADVGTSVSLTEKISGVDYQIGSVVYTNNKYYVCIKKTDDNANVFLYSSIDGESWSQQKQIAIGTVGTKSQSKIVVAGNYIVGGVSTGYLFIYNVTSDEVEISNSAFFTSCSLFVDSQYLYFYKDGKQYKVAFDDITIDMSNAEQVGTLMFIGYDGTYYYSADGFTGSARAIRKATSIDMDTNATIVVFDYADPIIVSTYNGTNKFYACCGKTLVYVNEGIATTYNISSYFSYGILDLNEVNGTLYATSYFSGGAMKSTDNGETWSSVFSDYGNVIVSGANSKLYAGGGSTNKFYFGVYSKQVSTDTYIINGTSVAINYYTKDGYKICIKDGGTNDTNLASVYAYMGYYPYFVLDTTGETVSIPRNSNLYSAMYVGDNFQDTTDGISGNATRLLPQAEIISDSSASVSLDVKGNKDYQLSASALTALTLSSCEDSQLGTTIRFTSGATPTTITDSASIDWVDGATPIPSASVNCLIFIWNKIGFYKEW